MRIVIVRLLFILFCFGGCLYHILYVNNQYFSYKTTTRVESQLQDVVTYPVIIFCAKITDLIDSTSFGIGNISGVQIYSLTIQELLDLTPNENQTLDECESRNQDEDRYIFQSYNCNKLFGIKKFVTGDLVCYQIYTLRSLTYSISSVGNAVTYAMYVMNIHLTARFANTKDIFLPAFYLPVSDNKLANRQNFPIYSRQFAEIITRSKKDNWIIMKPYIENYFLLPPPFDTNCTTNQRCYRKCLIDQTTSRLFLFPFSEPATVSHGRLRLVSHLYLSNDTFKNQWKKIKDQCEHQCSQVTCSMYVTTNIAYVATYWEPRNISLTVSVPGIYFKTITAIPSLSLVEYVSSLTTCVSIWFGFSVMAFNPIAYLKHKPRILCRLNLPKTSLKFGHWIYYSICLLGFIYQLTAITNEFFKFQTSSRIQVSTKNEYRYQTLTFCFSHTDLIDRTNYEKYGISKTIDEAYDNWEEEHSILTVKEILEITPREEKLITGCALRNKINYQVIKQNVSRCQEFFSVWKALRGQLICYTLIPPGNITFPWTKVSTSFGGQGQVYSVLLNFSLSSTLLNQISVRSHLILTLTAHVSTSGAPLPALSRNFAQLINLRYFNTLVVSSQMNIFKSLPAPYDTNCQEGFVPTTCIKKCIMGELDLRLNRLPFAYFYTNRHSNKTLTLKDLRNKTISSFVWNSEAKCKSQCDRVACIQDVSFTDSQAYYSSEMAGQLRVVSMVPSAPELLIASVPATTSTDFLLYICNCFGIWFGLSFFKCHFITQFVSSKIQHNSNRRINSKNFHIIKKGLLASRFAMCLVCCTGLAYQSYTLGNTYFTYLTSSRIEIAAKDIYRLPGITFCTRYHAISKRHYFNISSVRRLTIRDIFAITPNPQETLVKCGYRFDMSDIFLKRPFDNCSEIWSVKKYISGADVCYVFLPGQDSAYSISAIASALDKVGIIYELYLNNTFGGAQNLYFISDTHSLGTFIPSKGMLPVRSRYYGNMMFRETENDPRNYFVVQGIIYNVTLLPAPYESGCLMSNQADFCSPDCILTFMRKNLERVPFNEMIVDPLDVKMVSEEDLKNNTVRDVIEKGTQLCNKKCSQPPCDSYYTLTDTNAYYKPHLKDDSVVIAAGTPKANGLIIRTFPMIQLIDFLNNLAVSASIWFGVSILSFLMFSAKYLSRKKEIQLKNRTSRSQRMAQRHRQIKVTPQDHCQR